MLSLSSAAAMGFAPGLMPHPAVLPALARAATRPATMLLDHGVTQLLADAVDQGAVLLPPEAPGAVADAAAQTDGGFFDFLVVKPFEFAICSIHDTLKGAGVDQAFGPSIIMFTLLLKALTFPLNKQQIESTSKMQAIQPAAKALQEKYRNKDPARLNMEIQKLYTENQVNPLAGCLPAFAQIPIFIGLYRSVLNLAKEDKLTEPFLWLPSLEGPVSDYTKGSGWLFGDAAQGYAWNGLTPPLGWHDTLCYLALPVLLVVSQYVSTALLTPKSDDPNMQQTQAILKFLPLMIGWFSLNVPSGLGLYWMTNNLVTTATNVLLKKSIGTPELAGAGAGGSPAPVFDAEPKPQGFGGPPRDVISRVEGDTTVTISPPGASKRSERRKAAQAAAAAATVGEVAVAAPAEATVVDVDGAVDVAVTASSGAADAGVGAPGGAKGKKKRPSKKGKKKKN